MSICTHLFDMQVRRYVCSYLEKRSHSKFHSEGEEGQIVQQHSNISLRRSFFTHTSRSHYSNVFSCHRDARHHCSIVPRNHLAFEIIARAGFSMPHHVFASKFLSKSLYLNPCIASTLSLCEFPSIVRCHMRVFTFTGIII